MGLVSTCSPHPELGTVCDLGTANHPTCTGYDFTRLDYVDWPNPDYVAAKTVKGKPTARLQEMATRVAPAPTVGQLEGFPAGLKGSQHAECGWTDVQRDLVDAAILAVAQAHAGGQEFTSDAIWAHLDGAVPVTKGLTARLMVASRRGIIDSTGKTAISTRGGHHDHGQRLTLWYSLL